MVDALIKTLIAWYGGKRTLAPRIVAELGPHRAYFEMFCGGLSVIMAKPPAAMETVVDLHEDLTNLARVIKHPVDGPKFYRRVRRHLMCEGIFEDAVAVCSAPFTPGLDRAVSYFVMSWQGRNGISGTDAACSTAFAKRFTPGGGQGARRYASAVASIPAWRKRLTNVVVLTEDAFGVLAKIDDVEGVVIYCDPPYLVKTDRYAHDFAGHPDGEASLMPDDHDRLAGLLNDFKHARVVLSYYAHRRIKDLYPTTRWTHVDCSMVKNMSNVRGRGEQVDSTAPELLIVNGPSYTPNWKEAA